MNAEEGAKKMRKTEPMKNTVRQGKKHATRKSSYSAKLESIRRKEVRKVKYANLNLNPYINVKQYN